MRRGCGPPAESAGTTTTLGPSAQASRQGITEHQMLLKERIQGTGQKPPGMGGSIRTNDKSDQ
jgi:hypothetical protein